MKLTKNKRESKIRGRESKIRGRESKIRGRESKIRGREEVVRKREELSRAHEYAGGVVDTIREPLIVLSTDLKVVSANKSFYDTFKVNKKETERHLIYQLGNKQWNIPELRNLLEKILPKKKVFDGFEVEHEFPKIGKKTMLLNARRLDHLQLILLAIEDITERKKAEEKLKELDKAKTDFMNIISHELKTPLTAIYANLELLEEVKEKLSEKNINNLNAIRRNSNQLRFLVDNILEIVRIQSSRLELNISETDLENCIKSVENDLKVLADKKNIKLIIEIDKPINLSTDEIRLKEILTNLIDNAIKFTEKGYVKVKVRKQDDSILVEVIDTGIGITEDKKSKIFEQFYPISTPLKSEFGGTGIGLSITRKLTELLGGKINFKSELGKGSTFYFTLPIKYKEEVKK